MSDPPPSAWPLGRLPASDQGSQAPSPPSAEANLRAALCLLVALRRAGLRRVVLCPGSRSGPLAVAAGLLEASGLRLHTAIDERSAAFFALALGRAQGLAAAVITTSGSAVAQLLPACVEADQATIPLLLLSADRPDRLKGCGANQSVNQETFLRDSCRWFGQADGAGLAAMPHRALEDLACRALRHCAGEPWGPPPGPVHLNLPFEEPLHADPSCFARLLAELQAIDQPAPAAVPETPPASSPPAFPAAVEPILGATTLDPDRPGLVVAGPWRGQAGSWSEHLEALIRWQRRSGWPVLADPLSGLRGYPDLETIGGYDLLLDTPASDLAVDQVLRLGSLPASRRLERWLAQLEGHQLLLSEADPRRLDPLGRVALQLPCGLAAWLAAQGPSASAAPSAACIAHRQAWQRADQRLQTMLSAELGPGSVKASGWTEPALARQLSLLLPAGLPLMLANSSPVRDWESFADPSSPARPVFGFRGASGIDGTLSQACGLAEALGSCLLLSGDLALLHDANGWLWRRQLRGCLTVVVIDNGGGGIFEQLPILGDREGPLDFERLFAMPQAVDPLALAAAHGVPGRRISGAEELGPSLDWALAQPLSLLLVATDRRADARLRQRLRTMASQLPAP